MFCLGPFLHQMASTAILFKASFRSLDVNQIIPVLAKDVSGSGWIRNQEILQAVVSATLQLQIPLKVGIKPVARMSALTWSIEYVLCAMESGFKNLTPQD